MGEHLHIILIFLYLFVVLFHYIYEDVNELIFLVFFEYFEGNFEPLIYG